MLYILKIQKHFIMSIKNIILTSILFVHEIFLIFNCDEIKQNIYILLINLFLLYIYLLMFKQMFMKLSYFFYLILL